MISFVDDSKYLDELPEFIDCLHTTRHPSWLEIIWNVLWGSILLRRASFQSSLFRTDAAAKLIRTVIAHEKPDVVVFNMIRAGQYFNSVGNVKKIFDMDDTLSVRYKLMLEQKDLKNALGSLGSSLFGSLSFIANNSIIGYLFLYLESSLVQKEEQNIARNSSATVLVNSIEAQDLAQKIPTKKIVHIPNRVDTSLFVPIKNRAEENTLVFHGLLTQHHNQTAIENFLSDVFPLIRSRCEDCKVYFIGGGASQRLLLKESRGIHFTGYVDDICSWLSKGKVYVSWILGGSGMKTKILEAMALGIPIVTTSHGVHGFPVKNGVHCVISDDPNEFALSVIELLRDEKKRSFISKNARELVVRYYDERKVIEQWHHTISSVALE
ncbi:MAG TPA: glycosyltransferase family 4 protein [Candidatus Nitrosotenuis sp.]|nr:glycosyltransferase family 4 protein [Candidatus Nitrosotenuis sp.]